MAADLGELLVPFMPTIRVPRIGDRVFKSECAFSYDSPESEGGLYVCMNTFLGFGREHVERHYRKTGQCVYMHLKRTMKEKATGASGGAIPRRKNGKVFLDLDLNCDFNGDDYEYEDEARLVIFPDHYEIPLPNIEELPALVTIACDAVLNAKSPYRRQEPDSWDDEVQVSKHASSLRQLDNGVRIPPSGWKCSKCELRENLWVNLTDGSVLCGKWFFDGNGGNGHALEHYRETNYPLAVKLGTITPDGADVYSFDEEEAVLDPHLAEHLSHFGIDMLQMQKTENGFTDNDVSPRISEWEVIQESGSKLKPVYGSGYTGIKNLGNSCYLGTTMQVLFSIPEFQRAYVGNLQRIFDYSPLDPTQDFSTQIFKFKIFILDISIDMPDLLDITHLRATGLQPKEEELPDIAPPIVIPDESKAPEIDESAVMQLAEMGFPLEACRKAVYYTGNLGAEVAFNWVIAHMEEPDFAEPLVVAGFSEIDSSSSAAVPVADNQPPEESVAILTSMGFPRYQALQGLKATNNNLERALDWIFTHPDSKEESEAASDIADPEGNANPISNATAVNEPSGPRVRDGAGRYELFAFISHMGTSTMCGRYVCHIKKEGRWVIYNDHKVCLSERPPKDLGYIYFYHRIPS
ncbi:Ubiquitin carboxyl-terminal hydrolase 13 [Acipenser ruthenus]|uniref:ubiquitinyl hydrolase 1 n=1 Tax=Acipenser ruthenus TaxID=7906 RepID=A0A444TZ68_ACIRT|nr:Ubiquitin carboxyl-terminal hydrolase 13 [Acipenser ruthenus]